MKIRHFKDTDTVYIQLNDVTPTETREFNENTLLDLDADGNLVGITIEHATEQAQLPNFAFEESYGEAA